MNKFYDKKVIRILVYLEGGASMLTSERLKRLLIERFSFCKGELKPTTTLEHLSLDSLDKAKLVFEIENEFGIKFQTKSLKLKRYRIW
jgi:acyl carrier protein